jgi:hypothetical protein
VSIKLLVSLFLGALGGLAAFASLGNQVTPIDVAVGAGIWFLLVYGTWSLMEWLSNRRKSQGRSGDYEYSAKDETHQATPPADHQDSSIADCGSRGSLPSNGEVDHRVGRVRTIVPVVSLVLGLVGMTLGAAAFLKWRDATVELDRVNRRISSVDADYRTLDRDLSSMAAEFRQLEVTFEELGSDFEELDSTVGSIRVFLGGTQTLSDYLDDLSREIGTLQFSLALVAATVGQLRECVNSYMDVVGQSRGGSYRYYYC